jgi:hypothetical protein
MAAAKDLRRIALSLEGTTEAPHFDRAAFKATRIYATLPPDGRTANIRLSPEEQEFKCMLAPGAFAPIPNAWGKQGWTVATLAVLSVGELKEVLQVAWQLAQPKTRPRKHNGLKKKSRAIGS